VSALSRTADVAGRPFVTSSEGLSSWLLDVLWGDTRVVDGGVTLAASGSRLQPIADADVVRPRDERPLLFLLRAAFRRFVAEMEQRLAVRSHGQVGAGGADLAPGIPEEGIRMGDLESLRTLLAELSDPVDAPATDVSHASARTPR